MNNRLSHTLCTLLASGMLLLISTCMQAQGLRHSVCVVYPEFSQEDSVLLTQYALILAREGRTAEARQMTGRAHGSFGSGVLIDSCVMTNWHVIRYARTARLVFHLHERTITLEHCPIISASADMDLAAIAMPKGYEELVPLPLSEQQAAEDEDIVAAGFPGLQNKPSWQMTRGSVSNAYLTLPDEKRTFIQHTAAIDPGSSGGPLLHKKDGKYEVLGLNTLKAFTRDRVGIAVPVNDVKTFMASLSTPDTTDFAMIESIQGEIDKYNAKKKAELSKPGIERELRDDWVISITEDYMFSYNEHVLSLNADFYSSLYMLAGVTLSAPLTPRTGFVGGFRFGGFVPVRLNEHNFLVPQISVAAQMGLYFPKNGPLIMTPIRAGVDYRYEFEKTTLVLGVDYVFRPTGSMGDTGVFSFRHGISAHIGIAL